MLCARKRKAASRLNVCGLIRTMLLQGYSDLFNVNVIDIYIISVKSLPSCALSLDLDPEVIPVDKSRLHRVAQLGRHGSGCYGSH